MLYVCIFPFSADTAVLTLGCSGWIQILTDTETQEAEGEKEIWEPRCACSMWRCYTDSLTARRLVNARTRVCRCSPRLQVATDSNLLRLALSSLAQTEFAHRQIHFQTGLRGKKWIDIMPLLTPISLLYKKQNHAVYTHMQVWPLVWDTCFQFSSSKQMRGNPAVYACSTGQEVTH